jgi:hypothetical protein
MLTPELKLKVLLLDPDEDDKMLLEVGGTATDMRDVLPTLMRLATVFATTVQHEIERDAAERARLN